MFLLSLSSIGDIESYLRIFLIFYILLGNSLFFIQGNLNWFYTLTFACSNLLYIQHNKFISNKLDSNNIYDRLAYSFWS